MTRRRSSPRAFVLGEVVLVLVVSTLVVVALLGGLIALLRLLQPQAVKLAGETLPIAPTFGSFPSAVRLHQTFTSRISEARAIYVFGGRHASIPASAAPASLKPLKRQGLPDLADFSPGLPMDTATFYDRYQSKLGEQEIDGSPDDFSVVVVGPSTTGLAVTCAVQVRRHQLSAGDGATATPFVAREVRLWDSKAGELRYVHAETTALAARLFVGAVHTWMRYGGAGAVAEEGPACVVFPDPWVYAGARGRADDLPPFSRFSYFLPVSP